MLLLEDSRLDEAVSRRFYEPGLGLWPWRRHWLTEGLLHQGGKHFVVLVAAVVLSALVAAKFRPAIAPHRRTLAYLFAAMALSIGSTSVWKANSPVHCPWDVVAFGGVQPKLHPFAWRPVGVPAGHCFPGGHAAGGFSFLAFYFAFQGRQPRLARWGLVLGLGLGNLYGLAQVTRGAHFLSHHVWSGILAWEISALLFWFVFRGELGDGSLDGLRSPG